MYCRKCGVKLTENAKYCHRCGTPAWYEESVVPQSPSIQCTPPDMTNEQTHVVVSSTLSDGRLPQVGAAYPPQRPAKRGRKPGTTLLLSFLMFVGVFVFQIFGYVIGSLFGDTGELSATIGSAVGATCGMVALGGVSLIRPDLQAIVLAFKKGWWAIFIGAALFVFGIMESFVFASGEIVPDWPVRVLWLCALCAAIGFSEEGMFRGILLGGVLDVCGKNRQGIIMAAGISALLFGVAHVEWWSMNWLDPLQAIQAVLKMIQTGTLGFFFAALVIKGKSIWGVAILHGLSDLLIMIPSIGLLGESATVSYVNSGEDAIATIVLYLVVIAVYLPLVWSGVKMLREVPVPDRGAFHKDPQ